MDYQDLFDKLERNAIVCTFRGTSEAGRSHFGGRPDVPAGFAWPYFTYEEEHWTSTFRGDTTEDTVTREPVRRPLAFLAQFDCAELAAYDSGRELPDRGILSFFYEMESQPWGFDPKDAGCARVYWFEDTDALHPADFPADLAEEYRMPALAVTFAQERSLPGYEEHISPDFTDGDYDAYYEERVLWGWEDAENRSKLLGYADIIQGDMTWECAQVTNGIYCGRPLEGEDAKKSEALRGQEKDWRLLFQLDAVEHDGFELMFGDCGRVYFYIRQEDLANRRFEKAWLILQCY